VELHPRRKLKFRLTTRSLAQRFGVSAMAVSRIWADAGLAPANRPDRRRTLSLNCVYIVGISAVGAVAIGVSRDAKTKLSLMRKEVPLRKRWDFDKLISPHFQALATYPMTERKKFSEFHHFLWRLDHQAHPNLKLIVLCSSSLTPLPVSIKRLLKRSKRIRVCFDQPNLLFYTHRVLAYFLGLRFKLPNPEKFEAQLRNGMECSYGHAPAYYSVI
jgi:hypothetical protein